jgi:hypothetical protein
MTALNDTAHIATATPASAEMTAERREFLRSPDETLAVSARDGDSGAFGELERRYRLAVIREVACTRYSMPDLLVDEVFAEARERIRHFDYTQPRGFALWLNINCIDPVVQNRRAQL